MSHERQVDEAFLPLAQLMEEGIPFNRYLGMRVDRLRRGECVLRIPFTEHIIGDPFRPALHGGVLSTLADTAGGTACFTLLPTTEDRLSTVDLRVDYLRPGHVGSDVLCRARVVRMGNRVAVAQMELFSGAIPDAAPSFHVPSIQVPSTHPERESGTSRSAEEISSARAKPIATGHAVYNVIRRGDGASRASDR